LNRIGGVDLGISEWVRRWLLPLTFLLASGFRFLASPFLLASGFWLLACLSLPPQLRLGARFAAALVDAGGLAGRWFFRANFPPVAETEADFAFPDALDAPDASLQDQVLARLPRNHRRGVNPLRSGRTTGEEYDERGNEDERSHQSSQS
jgi:hypothetical protein